MSDERPQGGYKLVLVPGHETRSWNGQVFLPSGEGWDVGPYEVIGEVGENRQLRMSRALYDTIEVIEP